MLGAHRSDTVRIVLRSGAYITHDDGFYSGISPFADAVDPGNPVHLRSAIHGWARVTSKPEADLALLDAGKRDLPYDEGLPVVQYVRNDSRVGDGRRGSGRRDERSAHLRQGRPGAPLEIGDIVRLGLSHPCTTFDKWRLIPVIDDHTHADPRSRRPHPHLLLIDSKRYWSAAPLVSTSASATPHVTCLGEALIVLSAQRGPLETAATFTRGAAGAEVNVATTLAALGIATSVITRVGDDGFGRYLTAHLAEAGIDTTAIVVDPVRPTGLYIKERGGGTAHPNDLPLAESRMQYYRRDSAGAAFAVDDLTRPPVARVLHNTT